MSRRCITTESGYHSLGRRITTELRHKMRRRTSLARIYPRHFWGSLMSQPKAKRVLFLSSAERVYDFSIGTVDGQGRNDGLSGGSRGAGARPPLAVSGVLRGYVSQAILALSIRRWRMPQLLQYCHCYLIPPSLLSTSRKGQDWEITAPGQMCKTERRDSCTFPSPFVFSPSSKSDSDSFFSFILFPLLCRPWAACRQHMVTVTADSTSLTTLTSAGVPFCIQYVFLCVRCTTWPSLFFPFRCPLQRHGRYSPTLVLTNPEQDAHRYKVCEETYIQLLIPPSPIMCDFPSSLSLSLYPATLRAPTTRRPHRCRSCSCYRPCPVHYSRRSHLSLPCPYTSPCLSFPSLWFTLPSG